MIMILTGMTIALRPKWYTTLNKTKNKVRSNKQMVNAQEQIIEQRTLLAGLTYELYYARITLLLISKCFWLSFVFRPFNSLLSSWEDIVLIYPLSFASPDSSVTDLRKRTLSPRRVFPGVKGRLTVLGELEVCLGLRGFQQGLKGSDNRSISL